MKITELLLFRLLPAILYNVIYGRQNPHEQTAALVDNTCKIKDIRTILPSIVERQYKPIEKRTP
jgi:hypothetical protein